MRNKTISTLFLVTLLSACQEAKVTNLQLNELISLEARIGTPLTESRYVTSDALQSSFSEGDKIGLFRDDEPVVSWEFLTTSWKSETPMYWTSADEIHNFYAYYPFVNSQRNARTAIVMPSLKNQTGSLSGLSSHDFLVASLPNRKYSEGATVSFSALNSFQHVSSLLKFTFKSGGDLQGAMIKSLELSGDHLSSETTYSFEADEHVLFPDLPSYTTITTDELNLQMSSDATFYFIVNDYKDASKPISLILEYTIDDVEKSITIDFSEKQFAAGKLHPYVISIMNGVVNVTGSAIQEWIVDVDSKDIVVDGSN